MSQVEYDVLVIGGGFAGVSAALFAGAWGLNTLILEAEKPPRLWSYPRRYSTEGLSGAELIQRMVREAERNGVKIHVDERANALEVGGKKIVRTSKRDYICDALILATGARCKLLNVPGESWLARGTSYCAICDGPHFRGCDLIVVGSKNEAAQEALTLSQIACNVILIAHSQKLEAENSLVEELKRKGVQTIEGHKIEAIERGELDVTAKIRDMGTSETRSLRADAIFIALGVEPTALEVQKVGVKTHRQGGILVDSRQQTSIEGIFAAGDCTCGGGFNLTSSIGDGVKAGLAVYLYVRSLRKRRRIAGVGIRS